MKKTLFVGLSTLSLLIIGFFAMSFLGQESKESTKLLAQLQNPNSLLAVWDSLPMPLNAYSVEEIAYQKQLNEAEDGIMTFAPLQGDSSEWTVFDYQEITPTTWKVIALEVQKADGSVSEVELRRPNWWLRQAKADKIGNKIYLELHEVNIIGWATIKAIYPNLIDTRLWEGHRKGDYVSRPATGRFVHQTNDVVSYYFSDADTAIEATPNHPFYSEDRKGWVEVGNLAIGEKVRNKSNKLVTLLRKEQQTKTQKVYNLEIYRNHNYLVGVQGLLVHNTYDHTLSNFIESLDNAMNRVVAFNRSAAKGHLAKHSDVVGIPYNPQLQNNANQQMLKDLFTNFIQNAQETRIGKWDADAPNAIFYRSGDNYVVTTAEGEFLSAGIGASTSHKYNAAALLTNIVR
jgi:Pretoxin HINT domain